MYEVIRDQKKISLAQKLFLERINAALPPIAGQFTIGYQGDKFELNDMRSNGIIWFGHRKNESAKVPRYWNGFGFANELTLTGSNDIVTEANVALDGSHPYVNSVAACFAEDENGSVALIHTGKVGGGQKNVGKSNFLSWYKGEFCDFLDNPASKNPTKGILLAKIEQEGNATSIGNFVKSVADFKEEMSLRNSGELSNAELETKAKSAKKKPKTSTSVTVVYTRNPNVALYAKRRAAGRCDLCREPAPFADSRNKPYLECHHVTWLAHGGEDSIENTVALCPNCHRRMHIVNKRKDVKKLKKRAKRLL